ncbi:MAG TPA: tRNA 2-thiocytidine(32) synthetase TtcA [Clostridiales bacterium]|nr:tRNA 2-thiocytidine(32) synthetase TtcA [Clostridiales bacterium]
MIQPGDIIGVGYSGGKDSTALLYGLSRLRQFLPAPFRLMAVTVDLGFEGFDIQTLEDTCRSLGVEHVVEKTLIKNIVFDVRKEANPCSLCANMRRGALHTTARMAGCNKVALGHNNDDIIETFLMAMFYEGRLHTFSPVTRLDRTGIVVIRPLIYVAAGEIRAFIKEKGLPVVGNPCPEDGRTTRQEMRDLLAGMAMKPKDVKRNIIGAIRRGGLF